LIESSCSEGKTGLRLITSTSGFLPHTHTGKSRGQVQPDAKDAKVCLTNLSSSE
jgi:hypothetical protein